jgi:hypothetical protein
VVHTGEVQGSIPCAPTIPPPEAAKDQARPGFRDRSTKISKTTPCKVADGCRDEDFRILRNSLTRRANQRHDAIIQGEAHGTGRSGRTRSHCALDCQATFVEPESGFSESARPRCAPGPVKGRLMKQIAIPFPRIPALLYSKGRFTGAIARAYKTWQSQLWPTITA